MFAAAAVAAAAALTAISTTQSSGSTSAAGGATANTNASYSANSHGAKQQQQQQTLRETNASKTGVNRLQQSGQHQLHPPQYTRWNTSEPSHSPPNLSHFHSASSARSLDGGGGSQSTASGRPYISWKQYAMQRRNSMQRRKVEISRRLEQASTANQKKTYNIQQFQANKQKSTDLNGSLTSRRSFTSDIGSASLSKFKRQNTSATTDSPDTSSNDVWLRQMSAKVCSEFLRMHQAGQMEFEDGETGDNMDLLNNIDLGMHPTYKNFDLISQLVQQSGGATTNDKEQLDFDKISQTLYEYLRALNITQESITSTNNGGTSAGGIGSDLQAADSFDGGFGDDEAAIASAAARRFNHRDAMLAQQLKRRKEEKLNYLLTHRWDPKWLRSMRTNFCIPFAILALVFLLFTNLNANWIRFDRENQRAGLWSICNTTRLVEADPYANQIVATTTMSNESSSTTTPPPLIISTSTSTTTTTTEESTTTTTTSNNFSSSSTSKSVVSNFFGKGNIIKKAGSIINKARGREVEDCYSKFFLQEDTQLAIVCLSLISLMFHLIGTALLIIGFVSSLSSRTLYFYHSAGECLITSALVLMIDLSAFALVVQFQTAEHYHSFRFGYCFYINTILSILILACAIILHLDDLVNEWMIWKVKTEYASSTAAMLSRQSSGGSPKPADIFLSSI